MNATIVFFLSALQQTWSDKMVTRIRNVIKIANKRARLSGKEPEAHSPVKKKKMSSRDELIRRYPVQSNASLPDEDPQSIESHKKAIEDELAKAKPRDTVLLPLLKLTYSERRMYIQEVAASVSDILESYKALSRPAVVSYFLLHVHFTSSLVSRLSQKFEGGESLVTFCVKVVDFQHLTLVLPIRLQSETTCTCDFVSTQQKEFTKVGEMLFSDVQKRHKSKGSKIKFTVVNHHTLQL